VRCGVQSRKYSEVYNAKPADRKPGDVLVFERAG
jgi:hypothetical protein